jgi:hypothetical protein
VTGRSRSWRASLIANEHQVSGTWLPRPTSPPLKLGQLAEPSRLADGTLDPERATDVGPASPPSAELAELYERERQAVIALHKARATGRAPATLRSRLAAQRKVARAHKRRRGRYAVSLAGPLAAVLLTAPSGIPGAPSVSQAAVLGLRDQSEWGAARYHQLGTRGAANEAVTRGKVASNSGELASNRRTPTP